MTLHKETVTEVLWNSLDKLMTMDCLSKFTLVGGTALSLHIGHRSSIDIDMFTDCEYGTIDFIDILENLKSEFSIVSYNYWTNESMGNSCFIGDSNVDIIKLDLFYTDPFIYPIINKGHIRLASKEEILAMKLDVIGRTGRKKDFWDLHALLDYFDFKTIFEVYCKRYPYNFTQNELLEKIIYFESADDEPDPICLKGKYWELIKYDLVELVSNYH